MTALSSLLDHYRNSSMSEREKGTYFEELMLCYLRNEATYQDLYSEVWSYGDWAAQQGLDKRDADIDLVAKTQGTGEIHAIQCKLYAEDNLCKELPRIPRVKTATDFWAFSQAGRKLADLHLNYETVEPYPLKIDSGGKKLTDADYRVEKMRYGKKGKDLTTLHYNDRITLTGIPLEAYDYIVNGKPALDWVVERQGVKTDKDCGIVNDANDWAVETMGNPRYPLELFQRVVTVSLETQRVVMGLPKLDL